MNVNNSDTEYCCEFSKDKLLIIKNLSYDIKNAINGLSGFINLLDKYITDPEYKELLNQVRYSGAILNYLSDDLVNMTKEDSSSILNSVKINLRGLLTKALALIKCQADDKNIKLNFDYDLNIPTEVYGNGVKLLEIISNLLEYSLYYADNSPIHLEVLMLRNEHTMLGIQFSITKKCTSPLDFDKDSSFENYIYKKVSAKRDKVFLGLAISNELVKQSGSLLSYERLDGLQDRISFIMNFEPCPCWIQNY